MHSAYQESGGGFKRPGVCWQRWIVGQKVADKKMSPWNTFSAGRNRKTPLSTVVYVPIVTYRLDGFIKYRQKVLHDGLSVDSFAIFAHHPNEHRNPAETAELFHRRKPPLLIRAQSRQRTEQIFDRNINQSDAGIANAL